jgi:LPXTG-motif cell wall-anchored protein
VARADGDPASDVLIKDRIFWPYSVKLPLDSRKGLLETVTTATKKGFPVRVAIINNELDLGSAGLLSRHPQEYAKFLAQELALVKGKDWLIVVMPNGYGIYHCVGVKRPGGYTDPCEKEDKADADKRELRVLATPEQSRIDMAAAGEEAVRQIAALHGVSVDSSPLPFVLAGVVVVLVAGGGAFVLLRRRRRVAS